MHQQSYANWSFASQNVQTELVNGNYVSAESTLILGGPSRISHLTSNAGNAIDARSVRTTMFPIGIVQGINISQNRPVQRIFEVGSKRAYFIPGRLFANASISRVLFHGPSLMRMLYAVAPYKDLGYGAPFTVEGGLVEAPAGYADLFGPEGQRGLLSPPGFGAPVGAENKDFFINLASELFNIPMGICLLLKNPKSTLYGASYLEDVYVSAHSMSINANDIVIMETVNLEFGNVAPVLVTGLQ